MMELKLRPTEHFFLKDYIPVRLWQGETQDGTPVLALVAGVQIGSTNPAFAEDLVSIPPPGPTEAQRWAREVLERQSGSGNDDAGE